MARSSSKKNWKAKASAVVDLIKTSSRLLEAKLKNSCTPLLLHAIALIDLQCLHRTSKLMETAAIGSLKCLSSTKPRPRYSEQFRKMTKLSLLTQKMASSL